jgi:hypothetical protein
MKKLGSRNYLLISEAIKCEGTYNPEKIFCYFEENLFIDEADTIWGFLEWCHIENKPFGRGNYEERFKEFMDKLRDEFEDHLNSDSSFNYDEDEFEEWVKDLC